MNEWAAGKEAIVESISSGKEGGIVFNRNGCFTRPWIWIGKAIEEETSGNLWELSRRRADERN